MAELFSDSKHMGYAIVKNKNRRAWQPFIMHYMLHVMITDCFVISDLYSAVYYLLNIIKNNGCIFAGVA